jgi:hypothetical protein
VVHAISTAIFDRQYGWRIPDAVVAGWGVGDLKFRISNLEFFEWLIGESPSADAGNERHLRIENSNLKIENSHRRTHHSKLKTQN